MKVMKKLTPLFLAFCLIFSCFTITVNAANGIIFFSDLETKVGENFNVKGTVVATDGVLGEATLKLSYDTGALRFVEGKGIEADDNGNLTFTGKGDGRSDRLEFTMTFQALTEGDTRIEQKSATVKDKSNRTVQCEPGYSAVKIGAGDPSKIVEEGNTAKIKIDGKNYTVSEAFSEVSIPSGFSLGSIDINGETFKCAVQEDSKVKAVYLLDNTNKGKFWIYEENKDNYYPLEEIMISDISSIIILDGTDEVSLSARYQENSIEINGADFPVWVDTQKDGFYVFYAVNNDGKESLYSYDSMEHTYQQMEMPKKEVKKELTSLDKLSVFVQDNFVWVLVAVGCMFILFIVFLIVISIKLYHRNVEIDDLYDEYNIDFDDKGAVVKSKKSSKKTLREKHTVKKEDTVDWDDYYSDDDYDDDFFDDEEVKKPAKKEKKAPAPAKKASAKDSDDFDDLAELRADYESLEPKRESKPFYDNEDHLDDLFVEDETHEKDPKDDTFQMDFIDLE